MGGHCYYLKVFGFIWLMFQDKIDKYKRDKNILDQKKNKKNKYIEFLSFGNKKDK